MRNSFIYVAQKDHYRCPQGKVLPRNGQSIETENGRKVVIATNPIPISASVAFC